MIFSVRLFKGLFHPSKFFVHLNRCSSIKGFWWRFSIILLIYLTLGLIQGYIGMGTEELMEEWGSVDKEIIESAKIIMVAGVAASNLLKPFFMVMIFSLALMIFIDDLSYKKIMVVQLYSITILLGERILSTTIYYVWGIPFSWNVFSMSPILHMYVEHPLLLVLGSKLTIFHAWAIFHQYKVFKVSAELQRWKVISFLVLLFFFFLSMDAIFSSLAKEIDIVL